MSESPRPRPKRPVVVIDRDWESHRNRSHIWLWLLVGLLSILLAGASFLLYWGQARHNEMAAVSPEIREMRQQLEFLKVENGQLTTDLAMAQRSIAIDQEASGHLQGAINEREEELKTLKEELSFYKSIVDPDSKQNGLGIREFTMLATDNPGRYRYKVVATQSMGKKTVNGGLVMRVQGQKDEKITTLNWKDILAKGKSAPTFSFQYFEKLEGYIDLPEGFEPENILVKLEPSIEGLDSVQQSYSWQAVINGETTK